MARNTEHSLTRRIAYNTLVQVVGKAIILIISAVSIGILTRYLGTSSYGKFSLALVYMQFFGILADVGLFTIVVREISKNPRRTEEIVGNTFGLRLVLSLLVVSLAGALSLVLPYPPEVRMAISLVGLAILFGLMNSSLLTVFQAKLRMDYSVISDTTGRFASFLAVLFVVYYNLGFYAAVATTALGTLATLLVTVILVRRLVKVRMRADFTLWKRILIASIPLGLALAINQLYFRIDTIILSMFRSYHEVGLYSLAYKIIEILLTVPGFFMNSVFPLLSQYVAGSDSRVRMTLQTSFDFLLMLAVPVAVGGLIIAEPIILLAGGAEFAEAARPLKVLVFAVGVSFLNLLFGYALIAKDKLKPNLVLSIGGLTTNIILNFIFIPQYGMMAAAINTLLSELLVFGGAYWLVRRHYGFAPHARVLWKIVIAAATMSTVLWLLRPAHVLLAAAAGGLAYVLMLYILRAYDRSILQKLRG